MNKNLLFYTFLLLFCSFISCTNNGNSSSKKAKANVKISFDKKNGIVSLKSNDDFNVDYTLKIDDFASTRGSFNKKTNINIIDVIKNQSGKLKEISLELAKKNNQLNICLNVDEGADTTFVFSFEADPVEQQTVNFSGIGAKLVHKSDVVNKSDDLKRWLYRNKENVSDSILTQFVKNYKVLTSKKDNEYTVNTEIPIVHNLKGNSYSVSTDIKSDFYALIACKKQKDIDDYVEELVVNDFKGVSTNTSSISCSHKENPQGYYAIMLLCINKDWSYKQIPLALVGFDNEAPEKDGIVGVMTYDPLSFKNGTSIVIPQNVPDLYGVASVEVQNWSGNGLECTCTFKVFFHGDAKSAIIHRTKDLCYYMDYIGWEQRPENKVILAKDHEGAYIFTYKMHFEEGDNIIPITVEDYHGNSSKYEIMINAHFVRTDTPNINIDNNIYN